MAKHAVLATAQHEDTAARKEACQLMAKPSTGAGRNAFKNITGEVQES